jgi:hypothetical protein
MRRPKRCGFQLNSPTYRKRGLILNVGSFAGQFPVPLLATYAGSKSFLIAFSQALGEELKHSKVVVQNINAYYIVSKLSKARRASSMIPMPKQYVARTLTMIGRQGGAVGRPYNTTPWPAHGLMDWVITTFVAGTHWLLGYNYGQFYNDGLEVSYTLTLLPISSSTCTQYAKESTEESRQEPVGSKLHGISPTDLIDDMRTVRREKPHGCS